MTRHSADRSFPTTTCVPISQEIQFVSLEYPAEFPRNEDWGSTESWAIAIGNINPTGLLRKDFCVPNLPGNGPSIWGVSESQLSSLGIERFKQELRFHAKQYQLHHGAPAPLRANSLGSIGGKQVGSAFLANVPGRRLKASWTDAAWSQARFTANSFLVQEHWIHAATVYGRAHRAETTEAKPSSPNVSS